MKIVINACYGGFEVSEEFYKEYNIPYEKRDWGTTYTTLPWTENCRTDSRLIEFIEKYGSEKASGGCANLVVEEIPKGTLYRIDEYDGYESVEIRDETDWEIAT